MARRLPWIVAVLVIVAVAAWTGPSAEAASKFEVFGNVSYVSVDVELKDQDISFSSPGLGATAGGRYWFSENFAAGIMADYMDTSTKLKLSGDEVRINVSSTGFLGTVNYKFINTPNLELLGTAGVGSYTSEAKVKADFLAYDEKHKAKSAIGYLAGLELRSRLSERTSLTGNLGYRAVDHKKVNDQDEKAKVSGLSIGVGISYAF